MTIEEEILLFEVAWGNINTQFETWIAITFAVIIASYVAGHKLKPTLQILIAALYLLVTTLVVSITLGTASFVTDVAGASAYDTANLYDLMISLVRGGVFLVGTIATLIFIFKGHRDVEEDS
ncbi:MAG: hypothetical protein AAF699_10200 [Pseudomonadota bacterium]